VEDPLRNRLAHILILLTPLVLFGGCKAKKSPTSTAESVSSAAKGEALFKENCAMCHNTDSTEAKIGPGLKGLFKNKELPASHKPATEADVRQQILKGNPNGKPMPMPAFEGNLKPEEIDSLIEYLKTL
jgi:mono/diheme cytochrome c family protein